MYTLYKSAHFKRQLLKFARDYKEKVSAGLANHFLDRVEQAMVFIQSDPMACTLYEGAKQHPILKNYEFRQWPLKKFPHTIYFRVAEDAVILEAIYAQRMAILKRMKDDF